MLIFSKRLLAVSFCTAVSGAALCQQYINPVYAVRRDSAVAYGDAAPPNYCGRPFDLKMNVYKPVGDGNTGRPVVICVHGGAFTSAAGFNEGTMNSMAYEFARRGYVAVSINYREGHHLFPYGVGNPQFKDLASAWAYSLISGTGTNWNNPARLYVTDPAEVHRSLYRAQQDVKAAIRRMKARSVQDSTSPCKIFLAGHSAGAITVLTAALTDADTEKPAAARAIANAPNPNWRNRCEAYWFGNCISWQAEGPQGRDNLAYRTHNPAPFNYEAPACYNRPDLGPADGTVNAGNGFNSRVMGVAALAGALLDTNIIAGNHQPAVFLYHQPTDRVVNYGTSKPFSYLNNFFTPGPNSNWPLFYGSATVAAAMQRMNYSGATTFWTYNNPFDPLGAATHDILPSVWQVADSVARFFSKVMSTAPPCGNTAGRSVQPMAGYAADEELPLQLYPNPVKDRLHIILPPQFAKAPVQLRLLNIQGRQVLQANAASTNMAVLNCSTLQPGLYTLLVTTAHGNRLAAKLVKE